MKHHDESDTERAERYIRERNEVEQEYSDLINLCETMIDAYDEGYGPPKPAMPRFASAMLEVYKHFYGYQAAIAKVREQTMEDDLRLIDDLFGRDGLRYGDGPEQVKAEALRQLEIEWRSERIL